MPKRQMYRYVVPLDDQAHEFKLTCNPVAVAAIERGEYGWSVEFWAEHTGDDSGVVRAFRVFGTGHPLPVDAHWIGTCPRVFGLVWHLYEVTPS